MVVGANFVIKSLDPARTVETTSNMVNHSVYDSLVTFDGEDLTTPKPSLATDWTVSPDGKTYTFRLRRNVRFASGNPLTSADVKWSLDRVRHVKSNPAFFLNSVEDIQAPDPFTVVLKLKAPNPALLPILSSSSLGAVDSKLVSGKGGDASPEAKDKDKAEPFLIAQSAGTGAYVMERYVPDQEIVLVRNPNHWRGAAKVERIVIRNITEPAAQKLQLERGDLDIATGLDQDQMRALRTAAGVTAKASPAATTFYVLMNADPQVGGPFANPKVQQAVRYALDYDGILALAGPGAVRMAGIIPPVFPGAMDPKQGARTDRDRARAILKEANLGEVKGALSYASDSTIFGVQMNLLAQKIQADLAAVGISVEPERPAPRDGAPALPGGQEPGRHLELGGGLSGRPELPRLRAGPDRREARGLAAGSECGGARARPDRDRRRDRARSVEERRPLPEARRADRPGGTVRAPLPACRALCVPVQRAGGDLQQRVGRGLLDGEQVAGSRADELPALRRAPASPAGADARRHHPAHVPPVARRPGRPGHGEPG